MRFVVMAMVRRRYDRAACGADIGLLRQQAGVNFRMIGDVRAAKADGIILTGDCLLLLGSRIGIRRPWSGDRNKSHNERAFHEHLNPSFP